MNRSEVDAILCSLVEELAAVEHERWAHWQRYVHSIGERRKDGSLVIPAALVRRWERQLAKGYAELDEAEKSSDREQVYRYLPLIAEALAAAAKPGNPGSGCDTGPR